MRSQWSLAPRPSGSTSMSATFWASRTSSGPSRISRRGLKPSGAPVLAGGIESEAYAPERLLTPSRGEGPVLTLDVVDEDATRPGEERRSTQPTPLPEREGAKPSTCWGPS